MEQNPNVEHKVSQNKQPNTLPITQRLSKEKLTFLKKNKITNYTVVNPTIIEIDSRHYLILSDKEKTSFESQILFNQLFESPVDFLVIYAPQDIPEEESLKLLTHIKETYNDPFIQCRFIQTYINYEAYIRDMQEPIHNPENGALGVVDIIPTDGEPLHNKGIYLIKVPLKQETQSTEKAE